MFFCHMFMVLKNLFDYKFWKGKKIIVCKTTFIYHFISDYNLIVSFGKIYLHKDINSEKITQSRPI